ncbi:hypothetical protein MUK42_35134, partial [Musa troglodytarum]
LFAEHRFFRSPTSNTIIFFSSFSSSTPEQNPRKQKASSHLYREERSQARQHAPSPPHLLPPHLPPPPLHRGGTERLRGAALPRPPHRPAAQGGEGVRGGRRRPIPGPARRALHRQVRERGPLQRHARRHHLSRPDRRPLRRLRPGPLPLVPRPRHPPRRQRLRHHPLRRRCCRQAPPPLPLRVPSRLHPPLFFPSVQTRSRCRRKGCYLRWKIASDLLSS